MSIGLGVISLILTIIIFVLGKRMIFNYYRQAAPVICIGGEVFYIIKSLIMVKLLFDNFAMFFVAIPTLICMIMLLACLTGMTKNSNYVNVSGGCFLICTAIHFVFEVIVFLCAI